MQILVALLAGFVGMALVGTLLIYLRVRKLEAKTQSVGKGNLREHDVREIIKSTVSANGDVTKEDLEPLRAGLVECQCNIRKIADAFNSHMTAHQIATPVPAHVAPTASSASGGAAAAVPTPDEDTAGEAEDTVGELPASNGGESTMRRPIVSPASPPSVPTPGAEAFVSPASTRRRSARIRSHDTA